MIHHPLTSLAIFSPLLIIFRVHLTGLVVNALLSLSFYLRLCRHLCTYLILSESFRSCFRIILIFFSSSWPVRVFVHCAVGVSRSASLVLAYLMIRHRYTLLEAINKVKERRWIFPNRGFLEQLRALDMKLRKTSWVILCTFRNKLNFLLTEPQTPVFLKTNEGFSICPLDFLINLF